MTQAPKPDVSSQIQNLDFERPGALQKVVLLSEQIQQKLFKREFEESRQLASYFKHKSFAKQKKRAHIAANRIKEMTKVILETDLTIPLPQDQAQSGSKVSYLKQRLQERKKLDFYYQKARPKVFTRRLKADVISQEENLCETSCALEVRQPARVKEASFDLELKQPGEVSPGAAQVHLDSIRSINPHHKSSQSVSVSGDNKEHGLHHNNKFAAVGSKRQELIDSLVEVKNLMVKSIMKVIGMGMTKDAQDGLQVDRLDQIHYLKSEIAMLQASAEQAHYLDLLQIQQLELQIEAVKKAAQRILYNPTEANLNYYQKTNLNNEMVRKYASQPLFDEEMKRNINKSSLQFGLSDKKIRIRSRSWEKKPSKKSQELDATPAGLPSHTRSFSDQRAVRSFDLVHATSLRFIASMRDTETRSKDRSKNTADRSLHAASSLPTPPKSIQSEKNIILHQIEKSDAFFQANRPFYRKLKRPKKRPQQLDPKHAALEPSDEASPGSIAKILRNSQASDCDAQRDFDFASNMLEKYGYLEEQIKQLQQKPSPESDLQAKMQRVRHLKLEKTKEQLMEVFKRKAAECKDVLERLERPAANAMLKGTANMQLLRETTDIANWTVAEQDYFFSGDPVLSGLLVSDSATYFPELQPNSKARKTPQKPVARRFKAKAAAPALNQPQPA